MQRFSVAFMQKPIMPLIVGVAYLLLAGLSLAFTRSTSGIATVWPPSGLLLAAMLVAPRGAAWRLAGAAAVASMVVNLWAGAQPGDAAAFTLANVTEALVATSMLRRGSARLSFIDATGIWSFCKAAFVAALAGALVAAVGRGAFDAGFFMSWYATVLLGILIVTPLFLMSVELFGEARRGRAPTYPFRDVAGTTALVVGASMAAFFQSEYPAMFLGVLATLVAVFRVGGLGAIGSVVVISVFATVGMAKGAGSPLPIDAGIQERVFFLQFYLLAVFACALPVAALLSNRDRLARDLADKVRLLNQAEQTAGVGHWRYDPEQSHILWSPEVYRIHGRDPADVPVLREALDAYHPDDRDRVQAAFTQAVEEGNGFAFVARIVRADGEVRHVRSLGEPDRLANGVGLFGVIQDITAQVEAEHALTAAREAAERAAERATMMAETDPLTGLPNRRKAMAMIEASMEAARSADHSLSVAIFDIDHFKSVNDRFGHAAGDEVLRRVADAAQAALRGTDTVGRYGGEEFVLVLPKAPLDRATQIVERVRLAIENSGAAPAVTASFGIATLGNDGDPAGLLHRADNALYAAKREGRNRYRVAA